MPEKDIFGIEHDCPSTRGRGAERIGNGIHKSVDAFGNVKEGFIVVGNVYAPPTQHKAGETDSFYRSQPSRAQKINIKPAVRFITRAATIAGVTAISIATLAVLPVVGLIGTQICEITAVRGSPEYKAAVESQEMTVKNDLLNDLPQDAVYLESVKPGLSRSTGYPGSFGPEGQDPIITQTKILSDKINVYNTYVYASAALNAARAHTWQMKCRKKPDASCPTAG